MTYKTGTETRRKNSRWRQGRRALLHEAQAGKCYWCSRKLLLYPSPKFKAGAINNPQMEIEHIIPVCIGGSNHYSNTVGACKRCNLERAKWFERSRSRFIILDSTLGYHQPLSNPKLIARREVKDARTKVYNMSKN